MPKRNFPRLVTVTSLCDEGHRGDSHVAAAAAAGLDPVELNILTELWIGMPQARRRLTTAAVTAAPCIRSAR